MAKFSIFSLAVLLSLNNVQGWKSDATEFTVYGSVLCQDCTKGWNTYAYGATPIKGAKVDITCPDKNGKPVYHYSDLTDDTGYFRVAIPYNFYGFTIDPKDVIVRLVSCGSATDCNVITNFDHGKQGVRPKNPTTYRPDKVEYLVGPFYCTIPQCALQE